MNRVKYALKSGTYSVSSGLTKKEQKLTTVKFGHFSQEQRRLKTCSVNTNCSFILSSVIKVICIVALTSKYVDELQNKIDLNSERTEHALGNTKN